MELLHISSNIFVTLIFLQSLTRDPETNANLKGIASASYGDSGTSDLRGGVSGKTDRLGYYLDGGRFNSNGLRPGNRVTLNHGFGKLTYDLPNKGRLTFATDYRDREFNYGYDNAAIMPDTLVPTGSRYASAYLRFEYPLNDRLNLELFSSVMRKDIWRKYIMSEAITIVDAKNRTDSEQVSAKLTWGDRRTNLAAGFEYLHDKISVSEPLLGFSYMNFNRDMNRYGTYVNGSYSIGDLTLLTGVRLDHVGVNEQVATSYHLGATWQFTEKTLLRAYAVRGYSLPMTNFKDSLQNIFTLQSGLETSDIPLLWLKGTLFYSYTWNIQSFVVPLDYPMSPIGSAETEEIRRGFEIEGRTVPFYDFSLRAGYTYSDVRDKKTDVRISYIPISSTRIAIHYDNVRRGFQANIAGLHVNWPSDAGNSVHDRQMQWDLHISQKLPNWVGVEPELFFSGRNLFNNAQYTDDYRVNAPRWFEGGLRVKF